MTTRTKTITKTTTRQPTWRHLDIDQVPRPIPIRRGLMQRSVPPIKDTQRPEPGTVQTATRSDIDALRSVAMPTIARPIIGQATNTHAVDDNTRCTFPASTTGTPDTARVRPTAAIRQHIGTVPEVRAATTDPATRRPIATITAQTQRGRAPVMHRRNTENRPRIIGPSGMESLGIVAARLPMYGTRVAGAVTSITLATPRWPPKRMAHAATQPSREADGMQRHPAPQPSTGTGTRSRAAPCTEIHRRGPRLNTRGSIHAVVESHA
jgi:hypothetical protein